MENSNEPEIDAAIAEQKNERRLWLRFYLAAITGMCGDFNAEALVREAREVADLALLEYRVRWEE